MHQVTYTGVPEEIYFLVKDRNWYLLVWMHKHNSILMLAHVQYRFGQSMRKCIILILLGWEQIITQVSFCHQETGTIYTHHQKSVIVDADAGQNRRRIMAFVGGLDLCKGRYDTQKHPIFSTLQTVHSDDYHNPNFTVSCYCSSMSLFFLHVGYYLLSSLSVVATNKKKCYEII